jgi:hypothetical protein
MKNILLMQDFLAERRLDYVIAAGPQLLAPEADDASTSYLRWLDGHTVMQHRYFDQPADQGACKGTAGPRTHAAFAIALLDFAGEMKRSRGSRSVARKLSALAARLKAHDEDWRFCNAQFEALRKSAPSAHAVTGSQPQGAPS